jgi:DNA-binding MarR family transcriptional regulator
MKSPLSPDIVATLERGSHAVALWVDRALGAVRVNQAEAHALAYLARHAPCAIDDLHRGFGHKRSTLTGILDRLAARGWIQREAHPHSRRMVQVNLTTAGRPIADRVNAAQSALEARIRADVGDDDLAAFRRVIHAIEQELAHESAER